MEKSPSCNSMPMSVAELASQAITSAYFDGSMSFSTIVRLFVAMECLSFFTNLDNVFNAIYSVNNVDCLTC